ncbi:hypothetical protein BP6252_00136 [Coleophoma cylindrospora]|uniref:XRCC4 coiled-coil domain-containing protein n=1 Tax=Coleophoma cylindrospora TaxID=1849047 RepID=A0A3D8SPJ8_9HELO|nr:hypothetical protein BP6252_00136 [Coleophoma cylindrospora]
MAKRVLRFPRNDADAESDFVLVHITQKSGQPLNAKLIGTEGSNVYVNTLKKAQTSELKSKNFKGSQAEWDQILENVLLGTTAEAGLLDGIEVVTNADGKKLKINIRKRIGDITQRLGVIELQQDDDAEGDFSGFDWCGLALQATNASSHKLEDAEKRIKELEAALQESQASNRELVKAKADHEDDLLQKFSILLNEKKLKIRDQQRLLASAKVDPEKLAAVEATRGPKRTATASGTRKRKTGHNLRGATREEESEDEFEKMDVDADPSADPAADSDRAVTPDRGSETETETEDEGDARAELVPTVAEAKELTRAKNDDGDVLPPPRALPFAKKLAASVSKVDAAKDDGSETQSDDDDEL